MNIIIRKIEILAPANPPLISAITDALKALCPGADIQLESSEECKKPTVKSVHNSGPSLIVTDHDGVRHEVGGGATFQLIVEKVAEVSRSYNHESIHQLR